MYSMLDMFPTNTSISFARVIAVYSKFLVISLCPPINTGMTTIGNSLPWLL